MNNKLAIIVPYRDREKSLANFLFAVPTYMSIHNVDYSIYIIEQFDNKPFNRGKLCNIGYGILPHGMFTHVVFHDIDMIPAESVVYPMNDDVYHVASMVEQFKFSISYNEFFGGVSLFPIDKFRQINGFDNNYWGWGAEDDDLRNRCIYNNVDVKRAGGNVFFSTPHIEPDKSFRQKNKERKDFGRLNPSSFLINGLNDCSYGLVDTQRLSDKTYRLKVDLSSRSININKNAYVICIPFGGFNDVFVQILKCICYCERTRRKLIISTNKLCMSDVNRFFDISHPTVSISKNDGNVSEFILNKSVYPVFSDIDDMADIKMANLRYNPMSRCISHEKSVALPATFDFSKDYDEHVLFHCSAGGGVSGPLFEFITIKDFLIDIFLSRYNQLKKPYVSIHVRNTGMTSDVDKFLLDMSSIPLIGEIFLSTDNPTTLDVFRKIYGKSIISFSTLPMPDIRNGRISSIEYNNKIPIYEKNVDAICDLLLLACSEKIYHPEKNFMYPVAGEMKECLSGFTRLAKYLNQNKHLITKMTKNRWVN